MSSHQVWRTWTLQPVVVIGLAAVTWAYIRGVRILWRAGPAGRGVRRRRVAAFGAGLLAVLVALVSPLDAAADYLLSAHMAQHLLLLVVAAPLLVMGSPVLVLSRIVPGRWREAGRRWSHRGLVGAARRTMTHPVASWVLSTALVWAWHAPVVYDAAVESQLLHVLEHASFLGAGLLFWWVALQPSGPRRLARGADVLYVFAGALQSGALGALLAFAPSPIYPLYVQRSTAWGVSPLADQQLAGVLMWVPTFVVYLVAAGGLFVGWLRAEERNTRRVEARSERGMATPSAQVNRGV
jgi:putative membrane protein